MGFLAQQLAAGGRGVVFLVGPLVETVAQHIAGDIDFLVAVGRPTHDAGNHADVVGSAGLVVVAPDDAAVVQVDLHAGGGAAGDSAARAGGVIADPDVGQVELAVGIV